MSRIDSRHASKRSRRQGKTPATKLGQRAEKPGHRVGDGVRAGLLCSVVERRRDACAALSRVDIAVVDAVFVEWDELLDFRAGPRFGPGRLVGLGPIAHILFGTPDPSRLYDRRFVKKMSRRLQTSLGLTGREAATVELLEQLRSEEIDWELQSGAAARKAIAAHPEIRRAVERDARQERRERSRRAQTKGMADEDAARAARAAKYGVTRPKEFWHDAVRRLRTEIGLTPSEIQAIAFELRRRWQASPQAVAKALAAAAPADHPEHGRR